MNLECLGVIISTSNIIPFTNLINSIDYPVDMIAVVLQQRDYNIILDLENILTTNINVNDYIIYSSNIYYGFARSRNIIINNKLINYILFINDNYIFPSKRISYIVNILNTTNILTKYSFIEFQLLDKSKLVGTTRLTGTTRLKCFIYNTNSINNIGLFDENFYPEFFEDIDFNIRISKGYLFDYTIGNSIVKNSLKNDLTTISDVKEKLLICQGANWLYLLKKWKTNIINRTYRFPFNDIKKNYKTQYYDFTLLNNQSVFTGSNNYPITTINPVITNKIITLSNVNIQVNSTLNLNFVANSIIVKFNHVNLVLPSQTIIINGTRDIINQLNV
jgi:hypothetical protein